MIVVTWGTATDTGRVRRQNQDAILAAPPIFMIADGMGGHAGGEVAAEMAVDAFRSLAGRGRLVGDDVAAAVDQSNSTILARSRADPSLRDMGTTVVGLALVEEGGEDVWLAFNLGDSRLYRLVDGALKQLTVDHSYVQDLVSIGQLAPDEARTHPERNIVTRVLGLVDRPVADYWILGPEPGERFLLCSDGLNDELEDWRLQELLSATDAPEFVAQRLVDAAVEAGGRDNISVIVLDVAAAETTSTSVHLPDHRSTRSTTAPDLRVTVSAGLDTESRYPPDEAWRGLL